MKNFFLFFLLTLFSFSMFSMELDDEEANFTLEQEILSKDLKDSLDSVSGDVDSFRDLNIFANVLLFQDKIMNDLKEYIEIYHDKLALENSIRSLVAQGSLAQDGLDKESLGLIREINSPEALSLILQYPKLFQGLVTGGKYSLAKDSRSIIKNLILFPRIDELCEEWKSSLDSDINFFGKFISLHVSNARQGKLKSQALKNLFKVPDEYFNMQGQYFFIQDYIGSVEQNISLNSSMFVDSAIKSIKKFYDEGSKLDIVKNKKDFYYALGKKFVVEVSLLVEEYEKKRLDFVSYYEQAVKKLYSLIGDIEDRKKKAQFLQYTKKVTSYVSLSNPMTMPDGKIECIYEINFKFEDLLPEILFEFNKNIVEDLIIESVGDGFDFLPDSIKKFESTKKKQRKKKIVKKNRNQKRNRNVKLIKKPIDNVKEIPLIGIKAKDESYISGETDDYILIEDPKNNLKSKILKSIEGSKVVLSMKDLQSIERTDWVNAWYADPKDAFVDQGYTVPGKKYNLGYDQVKAIHSPAQVIWQNLILKWAKQSERPSRRVKGQQDILLTLPGVNYYGSDNSIQMGVFAYLIDSASKKMYHVNFEPRKGRDLMSDYLEKGYFEVEFPLLNEAYQ